MEFQHTESAVALIGLDGFRLLAALEVDGELHQLVETTAEVVRCPGCGSRALSKARRDVRGRDLPAGARRVVAVWRNRIWRCPDSPTRQTRARRRASGSRATTKAAEARAKPTMPP